MVWLTNRAAASHAFDTPSAARYHYDMSVTGLPALPGTYMLVFAVAEPAEIEVGRLGACCLPAGCYVYVGSALGPGGLAGRLARHLRPGKRTHWHIDYLAERWPIRQVVALPGPDRQECAWVRRLLALPGASAPVAGFGSSDCRARCPAHLVCLPDDFDAAILEEMMTDDRR